MRLVLFVWFKILLYANFLICCSSLLRQQSLLPFFVFVFMHSKFVLSGTCPSPPRHCFGVFTIIRICTMHALSLFPSRAPRIFLLTLCISYPDKSRDVISYQSIETVLCLSVSLSFLLRMHYSPQFLPLFVKNLMTYCFSNSFFIFA